jgi:hypothetical protein
MNRLLSHSCAVAAGAALAATPFGLASSASTRQPPGSTALGSRVTVLETEVRELVTYVNKQLNPYLSGLGNRLTALEQFKQHCLKRIHLAQPAGRAMTWDQSYAVGPTPDGAVFYGLPDTATPDLGVC